MSADKGRRKDGGEDRKSPRDASTSSGKSRRQKSGDLGRALRTIYDDTLREAVPDDFLDLVRKLG